MLLSAVWPTIVHFGTMLIGIVIAYLLVCEGQEDSPGHTGPVLSLLGTFSKKIYLDCSNISNHSLAVMPRMRKDCPICGMFTTNRFLILLFCSFTHFTHLLFYSFFSFTLLLILLPLFLSYLLHDP